MSRSNLILVLAVETVLVCLLGAVFSNRPSVQAGALAQPAAQTAAPAKPAAAKSTFKEPTPAEIASGRKFKAEDVHSDIRVLKGESEDEFMDTMGFFAASLSMNCTDCHVSEALTTWAGFAQETDNMKMARKMVTMVRGINQTYFGGQRLVTCFTCHRDNPGPPDTVPSLVLQYQNPPDTEPVTIARQIAGQPLPDKIIGDYIAAIGGQQAVDNLKSYSAKGTYEGFDTNHEKMPLELYVKNGGKRYQNVHALEGDIGVVTDGKNAWSASITKPLGLMALDGGDLDGAKVDAIVALPSQIKNGFTAWRTGNEFIVNDQDVYVIQGMTSATPKGAVKFYFDEKTHLLVREVRYTETQVGVIPEQIDFSDYRDVDGVKMPFHILYTWTDGQSDVIYTDIQPNTQIADSQFNKPAPAVPRLKAAGGSKTGN